MGDKTPLLAFALVVLLLIPPSVLSAQEASGGNPQEPEAAENTASETVDRDYYFEVQEDGTPLFRQVLSWEDVPNCFAYELILEESGGGEILRRKTEEATLTVSLPPGDYRYRIVVYNLLDKPELQTGWESIVVRKAEIPTIEDVSPSAIYMEEAKFRVILRGENLLAGAEYSLIDQKTGAQVLGIEDSTTEGDGTVVLMLPDRKIDFGDYLVQVVNPGGISDVSETGFVVRYQKPVDFYVSGGFSPHIPIYDAWVLSNWDKPVYAAGAVIRVGMFALKRRWGYLGPEAFGHFLYMEGGTPEATIESFWMKLGMNAVYKYLFTPKIHGVVRVGAGVAVNRHGFDYEGTEGPAVTSADLFLSGGLSLQYAFNRRFFMEIGGDWFQVLHRSYSEGSVEPFISAGYSY